MSETEYKPEEAGLPEGAGKSEDELTYDNTPLKKFPKIEKEDIYGLTLVDIQVQDNPYETPKAGEAQPKRRCHMFAVDGFDPATDGMLEYFGAASGRGDNNEAVAKAFKIQLDGPVKIKKSDLVGKRCRGIVAFKNSKRSGKPYPKIEKLLPEA